MRAQYPVLLASQGGEQLELYIEVACNGMFGVGSNGMINPPDPNRTFTLEQAELATFDRQADTLIRQLRLLHGVAKELGEDSHRGNEAMLVANRMLNLIDAEDPSTYAAAVQLGAAFFNSANGQAVHEVFAVGNCHIDTAW